MNPFTIILILLPLYALCAMSMIWQRRRRIKKALESITVSSVSVNGTEASELGGELQENLSAPADSAYDAHAAKGTTIAQMSSFVLSIFLIVGGLISLPIGLLPSLSGWAFILAGILIVVTPVTILVNIAWIFSERITQAEEESLQKGTAKLIKVERCLAWVAWACYTALAIFLVIQVGIS